MYVPVPIFKSKLKSYNVRSLSLGAASWNETFFSPSVLRSRALLVDSTFVFFRAKFDSRLLALETQVVKLYRQFRFAIVISLQKILTSITWSNIFNMNRLTRWYCVCTCPCRDGWADPRPLSCKSSRWSLKIEEKFDWISGNVLKIILRT